MDWEDIPKLAEQAAKDLVSRKDRFRNCHIGRLQEKVNLDEDYNYKHYYDIENGKWKVRGYL